MRIKCVTMQMVQRSTPIWCSVAQTMHLRSQQTNLSKITYHYNRVGYDLEMELFRNANLFLAANENSK